MYQDNYEPQHPMLKQMREEQALMDSLPEPMRISSNVFEASAGCAMGKKGFLGLGLVGWKYDRDSSEFKEWKLWYQMFGHRGNGGGKLGLKIMSAIIDKYNMQCEIPITELAKIAKKEKWKLYPYGDSAIVTSVDAFFSRAK